MAVHRSVHAAVVAIALALFICCAPATAYPTSMERVPGNNNYAQNLRNSPSRDLDRFIEGENLLRDLEMLRDRAEYFARQNRQINSLNGVGFGQNKRFDTLSGVSFGGQKKNFDEIDRTGFDRFVKKNFDEIDRTGFDRFVKKNFDEIDRTGFDRFVKKNFDEIDRTGFDRFVKKNFDEIDRSALNSFAKRPSKVQPAANLE